MGVNTFAGVVVAGVLTVATLNQCSKGYNDAENKTGEDPNRSDLRADQVQPVTTLPTDAVAVQDPKAVEQFHCDEKCWDRIRKQRDNPIPTNDGMPFVEI